MSQSINNQMDEFELAMVQEGRSVENRVEHEFVPGMYIRTIFMPKGKDGEDNLVSSLVHNTIHPYFILRGKVAVVSENDGEQILEAGYRGITTPNTRRILLIMEDTVWTTCHITGVVPKDNSKEAIEAAAAAVGEEILKSYQNPLLDGYYVNNKKAQKQITEQY